MLERFLCGSETVRISSRQQHGRCEDGLRKKRHTQKKKVGGGGKRLLGVFKVSQTAAGYYEEK